jgi:hypothetical protein
VAGAIGGSGALSDVDDLNSTPGGNGELFDVIAVGRHDGGAAAHGCLDHRGVDWTDDVGKRPAQCAGAPGRLSRQSFDLATIK